jgi:hypothetical protein
MQQMFDDIGLCTALKSSDVEYLIAVGDFLVKRSLFLGCALVSAFAALILSIRYAVNWQTTQRETLPVIACGNNTNYDTIKISDAITSASRSSQGTQLLVHGHCKLGKSISASFAFDFGISGDGPGATTFTFENSTDGFDFTLTPTKGSVPPTIYAVGFSIIRGPTTPTASNTGLTITAINTVAVYGSPFTLRDIVVRGQSNQATSFFSPISQWKNGIVLNNIAGLLDNVSIQAPNAVSDGGDVLLSINGPTAYSGGCKSFAAGYNIVSSFFQGGSVGVGVHGCVQGINIAHTGVIGDYDGIDWYGASAPQRYNTVKATPPRSQLFYFAPGTLGNVYPGDIVNAEGIPPQAAVISVDNNTGTIFLNQGVTDTLNAGTTAFVQHLLGAEGLVAVELSLGAAHKGIFCQWCAFSTVTGGSTLGHFGRTVVTPYWAGIQFDEGNNNSVTGNPGLAGQGLGKEYAIVFSSKGVQGRNGPNLVEGNIIVITPGGACVYLEGTTAQTMVVNNICLNGGEGVKVDTPTEDPTLSNYYGRKANSPKR